MTLRSPVRDTAQAPWPYDSATHSPRCPPTVQDLLRTDLLLTEAVEDYLFMCTKAHTHQYCPIPRAEGGKRGGQEARSLWKAVCCAELCRLEPPPVCPRTLTSETAGAGKLSHSSSSQRSRGQSEAQMLTRWSPLAASHSSTPSTPRSPYWEK